MAVEGKTKDGWEHSRRLICPEFFLYKTCFFFFADPKNVITAAFSTDILLNSIFYFDGRSFCIPEILWFLLYQPPYYRRLTLRICPDPLLLDFGISHIFVRERWTAKRWGELCRINKLEESKACRPVSSHSYLLITEITGFIWILKVKYEEWRRNLSLEAIRPALHRNNFTAADLAWLKLTS
jgi:hypothetical protein